MSREKKATHDKKDARAGKSLRERYRPPIIREIFEEDETPPRKRTGRPPELTKGRIKNIAYNVLHGASIDVATQMTGVPRPTFYLWRDKGRRGRSSTNPKEQEELALYIELIDTCEEALAARRGHLENVIIRAAEEDWLAARSHLERLDKIEAMVRARAEKRKADREAKEAAEKAAKEAAEADGTSSPFKIFFPSKADEPVDELCANCNVVVNVACDDATLALAADMWDAFVEIRPEHEGEFTAAKLRIGSFQRLVQRARGIGFSLTEVCGCSEAPVLQKETASPLRRLLRGEVLPIELLKKVAELAGVEIDIEDLPGTADKIRKALEA